MPRRAFPNATAMQPHIGVNEHEHERTYIQTRWCEYELLAFPDGYDFSAASRSSRLTAQYSVWKLLSVQARIRILGTPLQNPVTEVVVYRGLGGDSISVYNCINVKQMLYRTWRPNWLSIQNNDFAVELLFCRFFTTSEFHLWDFHAVVAVGLCLGKSPFGSRDITSLKSRILAVSHRRTDEHFTTLGITFVLTVDIV